MKEKSSCLNVSCSSVFLTREDSSLLPSNKLVQWKHFTSSQSVYRSAFHEKRDVEKRVYVLKKINIFQDLYTFIHCYLCFVLISKWQTFWMERTTRENLIWHNQQNWFSYAFTDRRKFTVIRKYTNNNMMRKTLKIH